MPGHCPTPFAKIKRDLLIQTPYRDLDTCNDKIAVFLCRVLAYIFMQSFFSCCMYRCVFIQTVTGSFHKARPLSSCVPKKVMAVLINIRHFDTARTQDLHLHPFNTLGWQAQEAR